MRIPQWFVMIWVVGLGVTSIAASLFAYGFVRDRAAELDSVLELPDPPQIGRPAVDSPAGTPTPTVETPAPNDGTPAAPDTITATPGGGDAQTAEPDSGGQGGGYAPWDDPRRVSVLLLGIDQREGEEGSFPTDTIILFSLDPAAKTAAILSIPRDLWVEYPGLQRTGRINGANIVGDEISYPGGGGPAYAVKAVEKVLGLRVQYYVLINFEVFNQFVDAIGDIEVCPPEPIDDDQYPDGSYGYISIHFDAGCQKLDSERLLQYARTRHSDSDIGRASRQQEVILSVRDRVLSTGGVGALIPEAASLWSSLQANIRTNLTFEEMVSLALTAESIPSENIRQGQIAFEDVELSTTADGEQVLVPIPSDIVAKIGELFNPSE